MKPIIGITSDIEGDFFRLRRDYVSAVEKCGGLPVILPPAADNVPQIADMLDGLLLPGGKDISPEYYGEKISVPEERLKIVSRERTDFELSLLKEVIKRNKPVMGICYGMQLINVAFGGTLYQDIEMQVKGALDHKSGEHGLKIIKHLDFCTAAAYTVNSSHHQAVKEIAGGFEAFALSDDGIIEGIFKKDYNFLIGVQWHPERSLELGQGPLCGVKRSEFEKCDKLSLGIFEAFIKKAEGNGK